MHLLFNFINAISTGSATLFFKVAPWIINMSYRGTDQLVVSLLAGIIALAKPIFRKSKEKLSAMSNRGAAVVQLAA